MLLLLVAAAPPPLTPAQVVNRHEALAGQLVRVQGWVLPGCHPLTCLLADRVEHPAATISLGGSDQFDRDLAAQGAIGREVIVAARVADECFRLRCFDRADQLADPVLVAVLPLAKKKSA